MSLFRDAIRTLPYAATMSGAILLAAYGGYQIEFDKTSEENWDNENEYNRDTHPDLYENYEEYVQKIGEALQECNVDRNIVKDYAFYLTMLEQGCISYGRDYLNGALPVEFGDALGATIATGNGVCRHAADNLADVLCSLEYDAKVVVGKAYVKGTNKPDEANHAVVYVEQDGIGYLLDPMNGTIYLKKAGLVYYDMYSQEDTYRCFEPEMSYHVLNDSENNNTELLLNLGNDFKKHWDILKEFNEYCNGALDYLDYFFLYEIRELLEHEKNIKVVFDDIIGDDITINKKKVNSHKTR